MKSTDKRVLSLSYLAIVPLTGLGISAHDVPRNAGFVLLNVDGSRDSKRV